MATLVVELYVTCPVTLGATVNVVVLIVAGFIALLHVAVIKALLGQTPPVALGGVSLSTVGRLRGSPGPREPAFLSGSPHPAARPASRRTGIQIIPSFELRIRLSPSTDCEACIPAGIFCE